MMKAMGWCHEQFALSWSEEGESGPGEWHGGHHNMGVNEQTFAYFKTKLTLTPHRPCPGCKLLTLSHKIYTQKKFIWIFLNLVAEGCLDVGREVSSLIACH